MELRQRCETVDVDFRANSAEPSNLVSLTLPRRYQLRPEVSPRKELSIPRGYGPAQQHFGASSPHGATLHSIPTIAKRYLRQAQQQASITDIRDKEITYLKAIERGDIFEVSEILRVYDTQDDSSSSGSDDDSITDEMCTLVVEQPDENEVHTPNGSLHKTMDHGHPIVLEMKPLETRPSAVTTKTANKAKKSKFRDFVKNSINYKKKTPKEDLKRERRNNLVDSTPTQRKKSVFDKNCSDQWGRSGLFIAISRRNLEMIDMLLKHNINIGECLYHATDFGYYDIVELLLKHDKVRDQVISGPDSFYPPGLTPIQLAAHKNDFIMLKILHDHGFRITAERGNELRKKRVFSKKIKSDENLSNRNNNYFLLEKAWNQSNDRILYYRALSSPAYLIMMHTEGGFAEEPQNNDFLLKIFTIYGKLKKKAKKEPDVESMYLQLANQVEEFACDLLNEVRSAEDLSAFLRFDPPGHTRATLPKNHLLPVQRACEVHMKNFVAHQHCQLALNIIRVGTLFDSDHGWKTMLIRCLLALLFPFLSIGFIIAPKTRFGSLLRNPMLNLSCHMVSDITFLALMVARLVMIGEQDDCLGQSVTAIEYVILAWVVARTVNEIKKLRECPLTKMLSNVWKLNDYATVGLFYVVVILRAVDLIRVNTIRDSTGDDYICDRDKWEVGHSTPLLLSEGCMSLIYLLIFVRALEMMYIDRTFGPLQLSLDKMLVDVIRFGVSFFLFTFFAFACGMAQLYWAYGKPRLRGNESSRLCQEDTEECVSVYSTIQTSMLEQFWTIFGYGYTEVDPPAALKTPDDQQITIIIGMFMSGLYHCWAVIVMLNMVIAMMSHSFDRVRDNAEVEWKFHRTNTWMKFIRKGVYPRPPPMNLIPSPRDFVSIYHSIKKLPTLCFGRSCGQDTPQRKMARKRLEDQDNGLECLRYRQAIDRVTNRYLRKHLLDEFQHDDDNSQVQMQTQHSGCGSPRRSTSLREKCSTSHLTAI